MNTVLIFLLILSANINSICSLSWTLQQSSGQQPEWRSSARFAPIDNKLWLWGGYVQCFTNGGFFCNNTFPNSLFNYNTHTGVWVNVTVDSESPIPEGRTFIGWDSFFDKSGDEVERYLVLYGGIQFGSDQNDNPFIKPYGDMWLFDTEDFTWENITQSFSPGTRFGPSFKVVRNKIYLFGGVDQTFTEHNDLWVFDLNTRIWTMIYPDTVPSANYPDTRYRSDFVYSSKLNCLVMYGGDRINQNNPHLNDTWLLNLTTSVPTWKFVSSQVSARTDPAVGIFKDKHVIALGNLENGQACTNNQTGVSDNPTDEIWTNPNVDSSPNYQLHIPSGPGSLKRVAFGKIKNTKHLFVWGGYDFVCPVPGAGMVVRNTNVWRLNVKK